MADPFSELRAWEPEQDEAARARARARLDERMRAGAQRSRALTPRRVAVLVAVGIVVVGAGVALASGFWRTRHTGHLPVFTAQGTLSSAFHVAARGRGYCWTSSLASGEGDAYRCMQGNLIHDPCFAPAADATEVACFRDPWHPVTLLRLTRPLPKHDPTVKEVLPWAIETTDGRRCTFLTGATAPMGGERINYGCTDRSFLIGGPDRSRAVWTIRSARTYRPDDPRNPPSVTRFPLVGIAETVP